MSKFLKTTLIVFLLITLFGLYNLTLRPKPSILLSFGGIIVSLIIWIIVIFKERPKIKRVIAKILLFIISSFIVFHVGVFVTIKKNKICYSNGPENYKKWKNIEQIDINIIADEIDSLRTYFNIKTIEQIHFRNDTFAIKLISNGNKSAKNRMLLISAIHGSEPSGYIAIPKILNEISNNPDLYNNWRIDILSPMNPVGLTLFSRENENGCDINRDFKKFQTKQASLIKDILNRLDYTIVLDLHEGLYKGHALLINKNSDEKLIGRIKKDLTNNDIKVSDFSYNQSKFSLAGFLESYPRDNFLTRFDETKVLAQYNDDFGLMNITSESDASINNIDIRVNSHLIVFRSIIDYYKDKNLIIE
jgi:hypothetical protein